MSTEILAAAVDYARLGLKVFPVGLRNGQKVPLVKRGFKAAVDTPELAEQLFSTYDPEFIGVVHDFATIIDIDVKGASGFESFARIEHRLPQPLAIVETRSGGRHYYYPNPKGTVLKRHTPILPGIDLLAGPKGYVLTPPSAGYRWLEGDMWKVLGR